MDEYPIIDLSHLLPAAQGLARLPSDERIHRLRADRWIGYPRAVEALNRLEALYTWPNKQRMPNLLLVGPTNNGKSMIVEKFRRAYLRRAGRVRARVDRRAHRGGPGLSTGTRPERRPAVQDDRRQAAAGDGGNGAVRDQGRRPVPGTWHHAADPVSAYFTQGRATSRWREATQPNLMPT